ncbi:MAG: histidine phosphatase family protein [Clostridiaceae bacterium]|nr:histidine phosphatase family protein [Clostridiaceae bacterium]
MTKEKFTVYAIRHGLTYRNLNHEILGSKLCSELLDESIVLIKERRDRGIVPKINSLWCSPLMRAISTAELYFPGMDIELKDCLAERDFGEWDGRPVAELKTEAGFINFAETDGRTKPPGGETYDDYQKRIMLAISDIESLAQRSPDSFPLALIFHTGPIRSLSEYLLPEDHELFRYLSPGAGGLQLDFTLDPFTVVRASELFTDDTPIEKTPLWQD